MRGVDPVASNRGSHAYLTAWTTLQTRRDWICGGGLALWRSADGIPAAYFCERPVGNGSLRMLPAGRRMFVPLPGKEKAAAPPPQWLHRGQPGRRPAPRTAQLPPTPPRDPTVEVLEEPLETNIPTGGFRLLFMWSFCGGFPGVLRQFPGTSIV